MRLQATMKTRIAAVVTALTLGAAPIPSALAHDIGARHTGVTPYDVYTPGLRTVVDLPFYDACPVSSGTAGNADTQTRSLKRYGQTAGGNRC